MQNIKDIYIKCISEHDSDALISLFKGDPVQANTIVSEHLSSTTSRLDDPYVPFLLSLMNKHGLIHLFQYRHNYLTNGNHALIPLIESANPAHSYNVLKYRLFDVLYAHLFPLIEQGQFTVQMYKVLNALYSLEKTPERLDKLCLMIKKIIELNAFYSFFIGGEDAKLRVFKQYKSEFYGTSLSANNEQKIDILNAIYEGASCAKETQQDIWVFLTRILKSLILDNMYFSNSSCEILHKILQVLPPLEFINNLPLKERTLTYQFDSDALIMFCQYIYSLTQLNDEGNPDLIKTKTLAYDFIARQSDIISKTTFNLPGISVDIDIDDDNTVKEIKALIIASTQWKLLLPYEKHNSEDLQAYLTIQARLPDRGLTFYYCYLKLAEMNMEMAIEILALKPSLIHWLMANFEPLTLLPFVTHNDEVKRLILSAIR